MKRTIRIIAIACLIVIACISFCFADNEAFTRASFCQFIANELEYTYDSSMDSCMTSYTDIKKGDQYYEGVAVCVYNGWVNGASQTTFVPDAQVSRREAAVLLYKVLCGPTCNQTIMPDDVTPGAFYYNGVAFVLADNIMENKSDGVFDPNGLAYPSDIDFTVVKMLRNNSISLDVMASGFCGPTDTEKKYNLVHHQFWCIEPERCRSYV